MKGIEFALRRRSVALTVTAIRKGVRHAGFDMRGFFDALDGHG
jgi:hypothetical protein